MKSVEDAVISGVANNRKFRRIDLGRKPFDEFSATGSSGKNGQHACRAFVIYAVAALKGSWPKPSGPPSRAR